MRRFTTLLLGSVLALPLEAQQPPRGAPAPAAPRAPAARPAPRPPSTHERRPLATASEILELTHEVVRDIDWDGMRRDMDAAMRDIDWDGMRRDMDAAMRDIDWDDVRLEMDAARREMRESGLELERLRPDARREDTRREPFPTLPPEAGFPQDVADSLYRVAREMLNRGEYRRAAETFRVIADRHPTSRYAADAKYWEAFALYRIGTVADMRGALAALEAQRTQHPRAATQSAAASLRTRVLGELAAQGDAVALGIVRQNAQRSSDGCDRDEMAVRVEALNALSRLDPAATTPALRRVLSQRDACSVTVRRRAVFLLGRQADASAGDLLLDVIRDDPDASVRSDAVSMVARVPTDRTIALLEEVARGSDARLASTALTALVATEHPRARVVLRQLIERADTPESIRAEAIYAFRTDKATAEDIAFLRAVYPRLESRRLKERTITTIARHPSPENVQWLTALSSNQNEPVSIRATAVGQLARGNTPIADVVRLYDSVTERQLKEQLVTSLAGRREPEAVDKLLAIARADRDPQIRRAAISRLAQKNDPRTTQLLLEIIDQ